MQDGKVEISDRDITTNLPYVPGVHLAFDHHASETERVGGRHDNHIIDPTAPSAAHVVYRHFGGDGRSDVDPAMMEAVDKAESAACFSREEILEPSGWTLQNWKVRCPFVRATGERDQSGVVRGTTTGGSASTAATSARTSGFRSAHEKLTYEAFRLLLG
jgi:hypothetical protein